MSFLKEFGVSQNVIDALEKMFDEEEKENFNDCADYVASSIRYLQSIGITNETIDKICLEDASILLAGDYNLKKAVDKVESAALVEALNNDIRYIDYLSDFR